MRKLLSYLLSISFILQGTMQAGHLAPGRQIQPSGPVHRSGGSKTVAPSSGGMKFIPMQAKNPGVIQARRMPSSASGPGISQWVPAGSTRTVTARRLPDSSVPRMGPQSGRMGGMPSAGPRTFAPPSTGMKFVPIKIKKGQKIPVRQAIPAQPKDRPGQITQRVGPGPIPVIPGVPVQPTPKTGRRGGLRGRERVRRVGPRGGLRGRERVIRPGRRRGGFRGRERIIGVHIHPRGWWNRFERWADRPWRTWHEYDYAPSWWSNWWTSWWGTLTWIDGQPYYSWQGSLYPWYPFFGLGRHYGRLARQERWHEVRENLRAHIEELKAELVHARGQKIHELQEKIKQLQKHLGEVPQG